MTFAHREAPGGTVPEITILQPHNKRYEHVGVADVVAVFVLLLLHILPMKVYYRESCLPHGWTHPCIDVRPCNADWCALKSTSFSRMSTSMS